ncbi:hypothetical protein FOL46_001381, partial [Perkinsus olseni]
VVTSLKLSSPQHYVRRPETINAVEYKNDMKLRGTKFHQRGCVAEVTAMIPDMMENNVGTRYFLLPNNRSPGQQTDAEMRETIQVFLRGILLDELEGDGDLTLAEVMRLYCCYYLVTVSPQQQQTGFGRQRIPPSCTCIGSLLSGTDVSSDDDYVTLNGGSDSSEEDESSCEEQESSDSTNEYQPLRLPTQSHVVDSPMEEIEETGSHLSEHVDDCSEASVSSDSSSEYHPLFHVILLDGTPIATTESYWYKRLDERLATIASSLKNVNGSLVEGFDRMQTLLTTLIEEGRTSNVLLEDAELDGGEQAASTNSGEEPAIDVEGHPSLNDQKKELREDRKRRQGAIKPKAKAKAEAKSKAPPRKSRRK